MQRELEGNLLVGPGSVKQRNRRQIGGLEIEKTQGIPKGFEERVHGVGVDAALPPQSSGHLQLLPPTELFGWDISQVNDATSVEIESIRPAVIAEVENGILGDVRPAVPAKIAIIGGKTVRADIGAADSAGQSGTESRKISLDQRPTRDDLGGQILNRKKFFRFQCALPDVPSINGSTPPGLSEGQIRSGQSTVRRDRPDRCP